MSGDAPKDFPPPLVEELFPFHLVVADDLALRASGPGFARLGADLAPGDPLATRFRIARPLGCRTFEEIVGRPRDVFLLDSIAQPGLSFRGQFVPAPDRTSVLFVGGPWLTRLDDFARYGIGLEDIPPHDATSDLLILLQMQQMTIEEVNELTKKLRETAATLDDRNRRIEAEMKARDELEHRLRHSQKMEAIGRLAGGIAHDFNNVLMAIMGYATLAQLRSDMNDVRTDALRIQQAAERAASITHQLLALSRQKLIQPTSVDPAAEVRLMEPLLRPILGKSIRFQVEIEPDTGPIWADPSSVHEIVMNLVLNARDAMPEGGDLEVRVSKVERMPGASGKAAVVLQVKDTGMGMDEATRARIFEPFFTTKEFGKGNGLGLASVYGLVQQAGGTVEVESAPGRGATFRVYVPSGVPTNPPPSLTGLRG